MRPSRRAAGIPPSLTFSIDAQVSSLRAAGEDVVGLGAGQPDFPAPPEAAEAARAYLERCGGRVLYTPAAGLPDLRAQAAAHVSRICGVEYEASQLVVTNGAKESLALAFAALADPGDEILITKPAWLSYAPMAAGFGIDVREVPTDAEHHFRLTPEALDAAIGERTRAVVINSPCNPTGGLYPRVELEALAEVVKARDISMVSDEIYWPFVFEGEHVSPAGLPGMAEHVVVVNGLSKSHAMTGWRIGFVAAPPAVAKGIASLKSHISSNICTTSQHAALGALGCGDGHTNRMREAFARRRELARDGLHAIPGVELCPPDGAFYVFPRVDAFYGGAIDGSLELAELLLAEERLAVVPGAAFGEDRCIRLSIAAADEVLIDGLERLAGFLERVSATVG